MSSSSRRATAPGRLDLTRPGPGHRRRGLCRLAARVKVPMLMAAWRIQRLTVLCLGATLVASTGARVFDDTVHPPGLAATTAATRREEGHGGAVQRILVPALKSFALGAQIAVALALVNATLKTIKDVWDELESQDWSKKGPAGSGTTVEEQDLPYLREADIHTQNSAANELATQLYSTGIPYESEVETKESSDATVEGVMKSLTRTEANLLAQSLMSPNPTGLSPDESVMAAWEAIGGLGDAKESLLDLVFPFLASSIMGNGGDYGGLLANPPGVMLFGPPGCGKSMLAKALAATVGARFLVVTPSCLLRKYVGETNINIRALFSLARKLSPTIIFVDELDGLFLERGGEEQVSRDLKTEFLQLWDGVRHNRSTGDRVFVLGATNRPFDVDNAFLRRMPRRIYVGLPDESSRLDTLKTMLRDVPIADDFDLEIVARNTQGFSPSDLRELLQTSALYPLREARAEAMQFHDSLPKLRRLRTDDVLLALRSCKPTPLSRQYREKLLKYNHASTPLHNKSDGYFYSADDMYANESSEDYDYDDESYL